MNTIISHPLLNSDGGMTLQKEVPQMYASKVKQEVISTLMMNYKSTFKYNPDISPQRCEKVFSLVSKNSIVIVFGIDKCV